MHLSANNSSLTKIPSERDQETSSQNRLLSHSSSNLMSRYAFDEQFDEDGKDGASSPKSTTYDLFLPSTFPTAPPSAAYWYRSHLDTVPSVDVSWETYLSPCWPSIPATADELLRTTTEPYSDNPVPIRSHYSMHDLPQHTTQYILASESIEAQDWPSICYFCNDQGTIYADPIVWNAHAWTAHFDATHWEPITCSYSGCKNQTTIYENSSAWIVHLWTVHFHPTTWKPTTCLYNDRPCSRLTMFKTCKNWLTHVSVVHERKFWCTISNCELRQGGLRENPFGTQSDLDRHKNTKHKPPIHCKEKYCGRRKSKLNRHDKAEEHAATWHGHISCDVKGCRRRRIEGVNYGFSTQEELNNHLRGAHHILVGSSGART